MIIASIILLIAYGWQMQFHTPLAPILVCMFLLALLLTGVMIANAALLTDLNHENAAAIGAAMNLTRLVLSAGAVAVVGPLIKSVGIGWSATITAGVWTALVPVLGIIYRKGFNWRTGGRQEVRASDTELDNLVRSQQVE
jgi:hypothetical protein